MLFVQHFFLFSKVGPSTSWGTDVVMSGVVLVIFSVVGSLQWKACPSLFNSLPSARAHPGGPRLTHGQSGR